jgi:hypothetical protein
MKEYNFLNSTSTVIIFDGDNENDQFSEIFGSNHGGANMRRLNLEEATQLLQKLPLDQDK